MARAIEYNVSPRLIRYTGQSNLLTHKVAVGGSVFVGVGVAVGVLVGVGSSVHVAVAVGVSEGLTPIVAVRMADAAVHGVEVHVEVGGGGV